MYKPYSRFPISCSLLLTKRCRRIATDVISWPQGCCRGTPLECTHIWLGFSPLPRKFGPPLVGSRGAIRSLGINSWPTARNRLRCLSLDFPEVHRSTRHSQPRDFPHIRCRRIFIDRNLSRTGCPRRNAGWRGLLKVRSLTSSALLFQTNR